MRTHPQERGSPGEYALKGLRCVGRSRPNAITPPMLRKIHVVWLQTPPGIDQVMLWAAFCLGFFGFLRSGEFTCPSLSASVHTPRTFLLTHAKIHPIMMVTVKSSKTDPFGAGFVLHLGRTDNVLCPVASMLVYLACKCFCSDSVTVLH